ncbi:MAG: hypothetical protein AAGI17_06975 [Planctomycetota bacterium]
MKRAIVISAVSVCVLPCLVLIGCESGAETSPATRGSAESNQRIRARGSLDAELTTAWNRLRPTVLNANDGIPINMITIRPDRLASAVQELDTLAAAHDWAAFRTRWRESALQTAVFFGINQRFRGDEASRRRDQARQRIQDLEALLALWT